MIIIFDKNKFPITKIKMFLKIIIILLTSSEKYIQFVELISKICSNSLENKP
jgi:hypothetical protein